MNLGTVGIGLKLDRDQFDAEMKALERQSVGTVFVDASLNTKQIERELDNLTKQSYWIMVDVKFNDKEVYSKVSELEKELNKSFKIKVDDKALTNLNKHFDKKIAHSQKVRREVEKPYRIEYEEVYTKTERIKKSSSGSSSSGSSSNSSKKEGTDDKLADAIDKSLEKMAKGLVADLIGKLPKPLRQALRDPIAHVTGSIIDTAIKGTGKIAADFIRSKFRTNQGNNATRNNDYGTGGQRVFIVEPRASLEGQNRPRGSLNPPENYFAIPPTRPRGDSGGGGISVERPVLFQEYNTKDAIKSLLSSNKFTKKGLQQLARDIGIRNSEYTKILSKKEDYADMISSLRTPDVVKGQINTAPQAYLTKNESRRVLGNVENQFRGSDAIGTQLPRGMVRGIERETVRVEEASANMGRRATRATRRSLRIQSPSLETFDIGRDYVRGYDRGLATFDGSSAREIGIRSIEAMGMTPTNAERRGAAAREANRRQESARTEEINRTVQNSLNTRRNKGFSTKDVIARSYPEMIASQKKQKRMMEALSNNNPAMENVLKMNSGGVNGFINNQIKKYINSPEIDYTMRNTRFRVREIESARSMGYKDTDNTLKSAQINKERAKTLRKDQRIEETRNTDFIADLDRRQLIEQRKIRSSSDILEHGNLEEIKRREVERNILRITRELERAKNKQLQDVRVQTQQEQTLVQQVAILQSRVDRINQARTAQINDLTRRATRSDALIQTKRGSIEQAQNRRVDLIAENMMLEEDRIASPNNTAIQQQIARNQQEMASLDARIITEQQALQRHMALRNRIIEQKTALEEAQASGADPEAVLLRQKQAQLQSLRASMRHEAMVYERKKAALEQQLANDRALLASGDLAGKKRDELERSIRKSQRELDAINKARVKNEKENADKIARFERKEMAIRNRDRAIERKVNSEISKDEKVYRRVTEDRVKRSLASVKDKAVRMAGGDESVVNQGLGFIVATAKALAPMTTGIIALSPVLARTIPLIFAITGAFQMLSPILGQVSRNIERVSNYSNRFLAISMDKRVQDQEKDFVQNLASKYSVNQEGLGVEYTKMFTASSGTNLQGIDVKRLIEGISVAIRAQNLSAYEGQLVFNAYTQMLGKGKISMEELRQQLGEKFPPAMGVFARSLGVSIAELDALSSKGALVSEEVLPKVAETLIREFTPIANAQKGTYSSSVTDFQNALFNLNTKLVESWGGLFISLNKMGSFGLNILNKNFGKIEAVIQSSVIGITAILGVGSQQILKMPFLANGIEKIGSIARNSIGMIGTSLVPTMAGITTDVLSGMMGTEDDVMSNMTKGLRNLFYSQYISLRDVGFRKKNEMSSLSPIDDKQLSLIDKAGEGLKKLFNIIPKGTLELLALVLMFEQMVILGKMFLNPQIAGLTRGFKDLAISIGQVAKNPQIWKSSLAEIFGLTSGIAKNLAGAFAPLAIEAGIGLLIMSFSKGDVINKFTEDVNKTTKSVDNLTNAFQDLFTEAKKLENLTKLTTLPSKGIVTNLGGIMGWEKKQLSDEIILKAPPVQKSGQQPEFRPFAGIYATKQQREDDYNRYMSSLFSSMGVGGEQVPDNVRNTLESWGLNKYIPDNERMTVALRQLFENVQDIDNLRKNTVGTLTSLGLGANDIEKTVNAKIMPTIEKLYVIDEKLKNLGKKRSNLGMINTSAAIAEIREVDKELRALEDQRKQISLPLSMKLDTIEVYRETLLGTQKQIKELNVPPDVKLKLGKMLDPAIEDLQRVKDFFQSQGILDAVKPLESIFLRVTEAIYDSNLAFERFRASLTKSGIESEKKILGSQMSPYHKGVSTAQSSLEKDKILYEKINSELYVLMERYKELKGVTQVDNPKEGARGQEIESVREKVKQLSQEKDQLSLQIAKQEDSKRQEARTRAISVRGFNRQQFDLEVSYYDFLKNLNKESVNLRRQFEDFDITTSRNIRGLIESWDDLRRRVEKELLTTINEINAIDFKVSTQASMNELKKLTANSSLFSEFTNIIQGIFDAFDAFNNEEKRIDLSLLDVNEQSLTFAREIRGLKEQEEDLAKSTLRQQEENSNQQKAFTQSQAMAWIGINRQIEDMKSQSEEMGISFRGISSTIDDINNVFKAQLQSLQSGGYYSPYSGQDPNRPALPSNFGDILEMQKQQMPKGTLIDPDFFRKEIARQNPNLSSGDIENFIEQAQSNQQFLIKEGLGEMLMTDSKEVMRAKMTSANIQATDPSVLDNLVTVQNLLLMQQDEVTRKEKELQQMRLDKAEKEKQLNRINLESALISQESQARQLKQNIEDFNRSTQRAFYDLSNNLLDFQDNADGFISSEEKIASLRRQSASEIDQLERSLVDKMVEITRQIGTGDGQTLVDQLEKQISLALQKIDIDTGLLALSGNIKQDIETLRSTYDKGDKTLIPMVLKPVFALFEALDEAKKALNENVDFSATNLIKILDSAWIEMTPESNAQIVENRTARDIQNIKVEDIKAVSSLFGELGQKLRNLGTSNLYGFTAGLIDLELQLLDYNNKITDVQKNTKGLGSEFKLLKEGMLDFAENEVKRLKVQFSSLKNVVTPLESAVQGLATILLDQSKGLGEKLGSIFTSFFTEIATNFAQDFSKQATDWIMGGLVDLLPGLVPQESLGIDVFQQSGLQSITASNALLSASGQLALSANQLVLAATRLSMPSFQPSFQSSYGLGESVLPSFMDITSQGVASGIGSLFSSGLGDMFSMDSITGFGLSPLPFAKGGAIGQINKTMRTERALSGHKARLIVANDGEYIIPADPTKQDIQRAMGSIPELRDYHNLMAYSQGGYIGNSNSTNTNGDNRQYQSSVNNNNTTNINVYSSSPDPRKTARQLQYEMKINQSRY